MSPAELGVGGDQRGRVGRACGDDVLVASTESSRRLDRRRTGWRRARRPRGVLRGRAARRSNPSVVAATASSRSRAGVSGGALGDQQAEPGGRAPADPAAQLVQLRDAEPVGVHDHHHRGVRARRRRPRSTVVATSDVDLAGGEAAITASFSSARQPAVQHLERSPASGRRRAAARPARARRGGRASSASSSVDGGSAPRRSTPSPIRGQTTYAWCPCATSSRTRCQARSSQSGRSAAGTTRGLDRQPAGRQLGQRRDVEVAEDGHRDRARDRRRGHDQHVRALRRRPRSVSAARCSTPNRCCSSTTTRPRSANCTSSWSRAWVPTTMPAAPGRGVEQRLAPRRRAHRAGEQRDPGGHVGAAEHAALGQRARAARDRAVVLRGEHLGRREQRRLPAGVDHLQHRAQRDHGLAGADLALQQPVHRVVAGQVGRDLGADLALARRSARTAAARRTARAARRSTGGRGTRRQRVDARAAGAPAPPGGATPRRTAAARGRAASRSARSGRWTALERLAQADQAVLGAHVVGQRVGDVAERRRGPARPSRRSPSVGTLPAAG